MAFHYNAFKKPNPKKWLSEEEADRIAAVIDYHFKNSIELPNEQIHALIHCYYRESDCTYG